MNIEDPEQLTVYLRAQGFIEAEEVVEMTTLAGGVSNRTVLMHRASGAGVVIKQALEKLRVKTDWFSDPSRIHREAEGIRLLSVLAPAGAVPAQVFEDFEHHLLAMEAVPQPHTNWKQDLLAGKVDLEIVKQFGQCLGQIHSKFEPATYPSDGIIQGLGFFESLRLEPYYLFTAQQVPAAADFMRALVEETRRQRHTLVHGDYSPKNVLVHNGRMVLLDHEVIHIGDPAFDVGFSMTHLLSKAHHLPASRDAFLEAAALYWQTYDAVVQSVGWYAELEPRAVRHTLACLLARVAGRSPLEYLSDGERERQQAIVVEMMGEAPMKMEDLIEEMGMAIREPKGDS